MAKPRRVRIFAWSVPLWGVLALYGTTRILTVLGEDGRRVLHAHPVIVFGGIFGLLIGLFVGVSQWLLGIRLVRRGDQLTFTDESSADPPSDQRG